MQSFYDLNFNRLDGTNFEFQNLQNKVVLITNTASKCGFTPQLKDLENIYQKYNASGFEILAFPSNQFGKQEPLNGDAIENFCVKNYGTSFTIFEKSAVKGKAQNPVFQHLYAQTKSQPRWNFHKFLIDRNGKCHTYFFPFTKPSSKRVVEQIEKLL